MLSLLIHLVLIYRMAMVHGFEFAVTNPTQCDDLTVTWSGGKPPFRLLIFKPNSPAINISIPSTAYQNSRGSFRTTLEMPQTRQVLFSMSDATGITAGGISDAMVIGPSVSGASCNLTDPRPDFYFSLPSPPVQCKPFPFAYFSGAVQPINVLAVVPLGRPIFLQASIGDIFTWGALNISVNSQVTFVVTDAVGRTGGSSALLGVQYSDDTSCISAAVIPSSIPGNTTSSQSSSSNPNDTSTPTPHLNSRVAIIAGATAGGLVVLVLVISFLWYQRRKSRDPSHSPTRGTDLTHKLSGPATISHLLGDHYMPSLLFSDSDDRTHSPENVLAAPYVNQMYPSALQQHEQFTPYPTMSQGYGWRTVLSYDTEQRQSHRETLPLSLPSSTYTAPGHQRSLASMQQPPVSEFGSGHSIVSDGQSTGPVYGGSQPSQVFVHPDIGGTAEPLELPPRYSEHRTPIPGLVVPEVGASPTVISPRRARGNKGKKY